MAAMRELDETVLLVLLYSDEEGKRAEFATMYGQIEVWTVPPNSFEMHFLGNEEDKADAELEEVPAGSIGKQPTDASPTVLLIHSTTAPSEDDNFDELDRAVGEGSDDDEPFSSLRSAGTPSN